MSDGYQQLVPFLLYTGAAVGVMYAVGQFAEHRSKRPAATPANECNVDQTYACGTRITWHSRGLESHRLWMVGSAIDGLHNEWCACKEEK